VLAKVPSLTGAHFCFTAVSLPQTLEGISNDELVVFSADHGDGGKVSNFEFEAHAFVRVTDQQPHLFKIVHFDFLVSVHEDILDPLDTHSVIRCIKDNILVSFVHFLLLRPVRELLGNGAQIHGVFKAAREVKPFREVQILTAVRRQAEGSRDVFQGVDQANLLQGVPKHQRVQLWLVGGVASNGVSLSEERPQ